MRLQSLFQLLDCFINQLTHSRRIVVFLLQTILISFSAIVSFWIRFDFELPFFIFELLKTYLFLALLIKIPLFHSFHLYRGWWRYSSLNDMISIFRAVTLCQALVFAINGSLTPFFPRSIILIDYALSLLFLGGTRLFYRLLYETFMKNTPRRRRSDKRVLIIGAGTAGISLLNQLRNSTSMDVRVVGFIDDSKEKLGISFYGSLVLGTIENLPEIAKQKQINEVYIAIPSISKTQLRHIIDLCLEVKVSFKMIPSLKEIIEHGSRIDQLREVKVEDLLGREPVILDKTNTAKELQGQVILVTGAGGSIGSEICRQVLSFYPKQLILYERTENSLFYIERELKELHPQAEVIPIIGDILDRASLENTFNRYQPSIVYHAAAYKHVPLMEINPREAVKNNVFGTKNLAEIAMKYNTKKFVMISTDKAVNPLNAMGYSKRLAELIIQDCSRKSLTKFISVRFGNVLGSSGSVVEIFRKQLAWGGPLTVTHPDATRFFMTTPEAVELILHAGSQGESGQIYILDMGQPVKIGDLAKKMIRLSDPEGLKNIQVKQIGLRPGEKMSEELIWKGENFIPSSIEKILVLKRKIHLAFDFVQELQTLSRMTEEFPPPDIFRTLKKIVTSIDQTPLQATEPMVPVIKNIKRFL